MIHPFGKKPPNQYANPALTLSLQCGTPGYIAPEVLLEGEHSKASDVFAMGMTIWALITGDRPGDYFSNKQVRVQPLFLEYLSMQLVHFNSLLQRRAFVRYQFEKGSEWFWGWTRTASGAHFGLAV